MNKAPNTDEQVVKQQFIQVLYERVIHTSNRFLHQCRTFHITVLALENPTYEEIAQQMTQIAELIKVLADDSDPMIGQKAIEYCDLMTKIGIAITNQNSVELSNLVELLGRKPGL